MLGLDSGKNMGKMMKISACLLLAAFAAAGCSHYTFQKGTDWNRMNIVMTNRSSHELKVNFSSCDWIDGTDTVRLDPYNGLWQIEVHRDGMNAIRMEDAVIRMEVVGKDTLWMDSGYTSLGRYNPCSRYGDEGFIELSDNHGRYLVYSFSDKAYQELCDSLEKMKVFSMTDLCPSEIDSKTVEEAGSSEAVFTRIYPVPAVRGGLRPGALVSKEAESIDRIRFIEGTAFDADSIAIKDTTYMLTWEGGARDYYYDIDMLRKSSLAHLGADFASLSGRLPGMEMKKSSSVVFSHAKAVRTESFTDRQVSEEVIDAIENGAVAVRSIIYGKLMYLVAEGDCSPSRLTYLVNKDMEIYDNDHTTDNIDYHLFTLDENGEFQCTSCGRELVDTYLNGMDEQPVFPIAFTVTDFSGNTTGIHIKDVDL